MKRQRVAEEWDIFARHIFKDIVIHPIQRREMRRAFYAGVAITLNTLIEMSDEDGAIKILREMAEECREFSESVRQGRA